MEIKCIGKNLVQKNTQVNGESSCTEENVDVSQVSVLAEVLQKDGIK